MEDSLLHMPQPISHPNFFRLFKYFDVMQVKHMNKLTAFFSFLIQMFLLKVIATFRGVFALKGYLRTACFDLIYCHSKKHYQSFS